MLSVTSAQLDAWLTLFVFPLSRILGVMATAPIFNSVGTPLRVRLGIGLAISLALTPNLPPMPSVPAGSWIGFAVIAEQALIGILIGFALRLAIAAVDVAGEIIGLQMGLGFAVSYDPQNAGQTPVLSEYLGLITSLLFLAMNGHLMVIAVLAESFALLPVSAPPLPGSGLATLLRWSGVIFATGLLLALPLIAALLITNIALGILSRIAPQLNLFAIGFPVTLAIGFLVLMLLMPYFGAALDRLFHQSFEVMHQILKASGG